LSLRRVLVENMADELVASGIIVPDDAFWHPTPLWCRYCGTHKLLGQVSLDGMLILRCPSCSRMQDEAHSEAQLPAPYRSMKGYKTLFRKMLIMAHTETREWFSGRPGNCPRCGMPLLVRLGHLHASPLVGGHLGVQRICTNPGCDASATGGQVFDSTTLATLSLALSKALSFWHEHSHLLRLPEREMEHQGIPAILVSFQDKQGPARLDVISSRDSFEPLGSHLVRAR
jgi:phage FluMu protein Com